MGTDPYALTPERAQALEGFVDDLFNEHRELDRMALELLLRRHRLRVVIETEADPDDLQEMAHSAGYEQGVQALEDMLVDKDNVDAVLARSDRRSPPTRCIPVEVISEYASGLLEGE